MQQLETGGNEVLPVLAIAMGLFFRGAMYDTVTHQHRCLHPSQSGSCLFLVDSSRLITGSRLVRVALESRPYYGLYYLVCEAAMNPCAPLVTIRGRMLGKANKLSCGL
jgi:hypothetical protein